MGILKGILGGIDIPKLIKDKNYDGLLKATAKKDPDLKRTALRAFDSLGESARGYLIANLGKRVDAFLGVREALQNVRSAEVLRELGWVPGTFAERILFLMGLDSWQDLTDLGEEAKAPLMQIVKSMDLGNGIRTAALIALGHFHQHEVASFLVEDLKESCATNAPDAHVAMGCLKRMGGVAVDSLAAALSDPKCTQRAWVWASQTLAMIGRPSIEALIAVNKNPPGTGVKAMESWTFSLQALAGTADEKALDYVRNCALPVLRDNHASKGTRFSEETKFIQTILDIFKDPPRSIVKYVKLGGPMMSYKIIATMASGNRRETQSVEAFSLSGGTGFLQGVFGSPNSVMMDALDKIGGDDATKKMVDFIKGIIGPERVTEQIMMIDKNVHPSMMEYLNEYRKKSAFFLDRAASALTLIHLNKRQVQNSGGTSASGPTSEGGCE